MSGIGALVGKLAGGDPVKKLRQLADLGNDLSKTAAAIQSINGAFAGFNEVDKFASSISNLADTMDKLNKSISSISLLSMAKLTAAVAMSPRVSDANVPTGSPASETTAAMRPFIDLMRYSHRGLIGMKKRSCEDFSQLRF